MSLGSGASFLVNFVGTLFFILQFAIIIRALMSWFNPSPDNPVVRIVYELTEPILAPIRRYLPPTGGIDWSPLIAMLLMSVILRVVSSL